MRVDNDSLNRVAVDSIGPASLAPADPTAVHARLSGVTNPGEPAEGRESSTAEPASRRMPDEGRNVSRLISLVLLDILLMLGSAFLAMTIETEKFPALVLGQIVSWWIGLVAVGGYTLFNRRAVRAGTTLRAVGIASITALVVSIVMQRTPDSGFLLVMLAFFAGSFAGRLLIGGATRDRVVAVTASRSYSSDAIDQLVICQDESADELVQRIVDRCELVNASAVSIEQTAGLTVETIQRLAWQLRLAHVDLRFAFATGPTAPHRIASFVDGAHAGLEIRSPKPTAGGLLAKRVFDLFLSSALLIVVSPVMLVVVVMVATTSKGGAFFTQERIGKDGRRFTVYKFRTMVVGADAQWAALSQEQGQGSVPLFKMVNDPRRTRVGAVLRRYSIDELPQLFNVWLGSMSLVGPRPPLPAEVALYDSLAMHRLGVLPGMTGLWQVSGRSRLGWQKARELDVSYVHNWSFKHDLVIILRTAKAVFGADGAY